MAITPDGRRAVSVAAFEIKVWDLGTGDCTTSMTTEIMYQWESANVCAITPDGRRVLYGSGESYAVRVASLVGK